MRVAVSAADPATSRAEVLVVTMREGSRSIEGLPAGRLRKEIEAVAAAERFRAKRGRSLLFRTTGRHPVRRVVVAGLGRGESLDVDALRAAAAEGARRAAGVSAARVVYAPPPGADDRIGISARVRAIVEGCVLGSYRLRRYLTGEERDEEASLRDATLLVPASNLADARVAARRAAIACGAVNLARDIVNEPAREITPTRMAAIATALGARAGLEVKVLDEQGIRKLGMGAFLGVAAGSHQPPRLIHLTYRPPGEPDRTIVLVGKGLTFDSGGLSLKTAQGMETMKLDKSGAVAVLCAMLQLPALKPGAVVHGLLGMTENMPGGAAMKPGDVVRTMGGKTIEVLNTDAEGRLVLADLLGYARSLGADEIIDLATLTGAIMVALGPLAAGVFGNDPAMVARVLSAAERGGEKAWPMPMYEEYREQIRSEIADVKNTGERYGGAITAAMFLREFAGRRTPWVHLDIAGPAFLESNAHPYMRRGATGAGVRTLLSYLVPEDGA